MTANHENNRSDIDDLKARVDLVELIRQSGVELSQSGKGLLGRCPFHDDSTASLSVTPTRTSGTALAARPGVTSWNGSG